MGSKSSGFGAAGSGNIALARQLTAEHDPSIICRDGEVSSRQNAASFEQSWKSSPSGVSVGLRLSATHGALQPPNNLSNVVAVAAGGYFNVALKSDGRVVGWGDNSWGQKPTEQSPNGEPTLAVT